jgi:hypothetical protein
MICYAIMASIIFLPACTIGDFVAIVFGSGNVVKESRTIKGIDGVSVSHGMNLILTQSQSESLEIEAEDNVIPYIETMTSGSNLTVRFRDRFPGIHFFQPTRPIMIHLSMINIQRVDLSGGSSLDSGEINTSRLELNISGGGRADIKQLQTEELDADLSGGSQGEIAGKTGETRLYMSGGSGLRAGDLECTLLKTHISGGGSLRINTFKADELDANLSGGSHATIGGKIGKIHLDASGGSNLDAANLESSAAKIFMSGGGDSEVWVTKSLSADLSGGSTLHYYGNPEISQKTSGSSDVISEGVHP